MKITVMVHLRMYRAKRVFWSTGYGLGAVSADLNRDGWPDIYVSNDIELDDVLYINNMDGPILCRQT